MKMVALEEYCPEPSSPSDNAYPEGGRKAWLAVLGAWCALVPSAGFLNTLGALQAWTSSHQLKDYSESSIGWIYGAYGFFVYLAGAQTGVLMYDSGYSH